MATHHTNIRGQKLPAGMERFFSSTNLERYRKLANGTIAAAEQQALLKDLAEEMNAFRREARGAAEQGRGIFMTTSDLKLVTGYDPPRSILRQP